MFNPKVFVAEFIGTFALVFVGAAAGIYNTVSSLGVGLLGIALAHGLTLAVFVYVYGHISGTHVNPAVTLGLALNGTVKWLEAVVYWVAQFSGAVLAALLLKTLFGLISSDLVAGMATHGVLTTEYTYYALGLEALLTFFLVSAVLHAAVEGKAGQFAGLAIGATYMIAILAGAPLTGASLNPARSFGPAVFASVLQPGMPDYQNPTFYLVYFVGPFVGAILAVLVYQFFKLEFVMVDDLNDEDDELDLEAEAEVVAVVEEVIVEEPVKKPARKPVARKSTTRKTPAKK